MQEVWGYLAPALLLAVAFLYDAISNTSPAEQAELPASAFSGRMFKAPPLTTIQLSQTVEVVEEHPLEEKVFLSEKRSIDERFGVDRH